MTTPAPLLSEDEFLALPESKTKVELLDGEVVVAPAPTHWHQEILVRLVFALRSWARERKPRPTVGQGPDDIRFGAGRILQPDAFVHLDPLRAREPSPVGRVPDLCVEVLSSDRAYDRITKRVVYAEAGVREYWLIDPAGAVERRTGPGLQAVERCAERLESDLLPGFALPLAELFAD